MRIDRADVYVVKLDRHWKRAYSRTTDSCFLKLTTANGTTAWGEAQAPLSPETVASILIRLLVPALPGQPATANEIIYDRLYQMMLVRGLNSGFYLDTIAGIDLALWVPNGKVWQAPVCEILGGPFRERLPAYISRLRRPTAAERIQLARECIKRGFQGLTQFLSADVGDIGEDLAAILALDNIDAPPVRDALQVGRDLGRVSASCYEAPIL